MDWEKRFTDYLQGVPNDAAHDIGHFRRVAHTAKQIALLETSDADPLTLLAAAYFHDLVTFPKNHPENRFSSRYSAKKAQEVLRAMGFPEEKIAPVCHAIEAHSFTARISPETLEAKIIQDADRMDALGALGILRTFYVSGIMGSLPFHLSDPLAKNRDLNDKAFALDHFYCKLFKIPDLLQTTGGRKIAMDRTEFLYFFVSELATDLQKGDGGALFVATASHEAGTKKLPLEAIQSRISESRDLFPEFLPVFMSELEREFS